MSKTVAKSSKSGKGKKGDGKELKKWERKVIVIKKANPQKLMENFFPITKPKRVFPEKNFQGFPLSECRYVEDLHEYVYCPPEYGRKTAMMPQGEWTVCPHCLLNPCMKVEKWDDIMGFCGDQLVFDDDSDAAFEMLYHKGWHHIDALHVEIFGAQYFRRREPPACALRLVNEYFDEVNKDRNCHGMMEEDDPDQELIAGAVDADELLLTQPF